MNYVYIRITFNYRLSSYNMYINCLFKLTIYIVLWKYKQLYLSLVHISFNISCLLQTFVFDFHINTIENISHLKYNNMFSDYHFPALMVCCNKQANMEMNTLRSDRNEQV